MFDITQLFSDLTEFLNKVNSIVWGPWMILLLLGTGIYLSIRTGLVQIFKLPLAFRALKPSKEDDQGSGDVSTFGALSIALAATIGTGSIVGIATAVSIGGPGAIFWLFIVSFVGMATKYAESFLAIRYRIKDELGQMSGGPMYYIEGGLGKNWKWLAILFAFFGMFGGTLGAGTLPQVDVMINSTQKVFLSYFSLEESFTVKVILGLLFSFLVAIVTLGSVKRISKVSELLMPLFAGLYILGCLVILLMNLGNILPSLKSIVVDAFTPSAAVGGFTGATVMMAIQMGVSRGIYSNEAGLGTTPIASAAAKTSSPVRQGLVAMLSSFFTLIVGISTGLVIVISGVWNQEGLRPADMTAVAFEQSLGHLGGIIVFTTLILFAYTTIIGWNYYGSRCVEYLFGSKGVIVYRYVFPLILFGCVFLSFDFVWVLSDIINGLMAIPNLIALLLLSSIVGVETKAHFARKDKEDSF